MHSGLVLNDSVIISHVLKKGSRRVTTRREKTDGFSISKLSKNKLNGGVNKKGRVGALRPPTVTNDGDFDDGPADFAGFRDILDNIEVDGWRILLELIKSIELKFYRQSDVDSTFQIHIIQDFDLVDNSLSARQKVNAICFYRKPGHRFPIGYCSRCDEISNPFDMLLQIESNQLEFSVMRCLNLKIGILYLLQDLSIPLPEPVEHRSLIDLLNQLMYIPKNIPFGELEINRCVFKAYEIYVFALDPLNFGLQVFGIKQPQEGVQIVLCMLCNANRRTCNHCQLLKDKMEICSSLIAADYEAEPPDNLLFSTNHYPVDYRQDLHLQALITERYEISELWFNQKFPDKFIKANHCEIAGHDRFETTVKKARIVCNYFIEGFQTCSYTCLDCRSTSHYEERNDGLINYNNSILFSVEIFYSLLKYKIHGGLSTNAYWKQIVDLSASKRVLDKLLEPGKDEYVWTTRKYSAAGKFNQIFAEFCGLIDHSPELFKCCEVPQAICLDGTVMSCETRRIKKANLKQPWLVKSDYKSNRVTSVKDREFDLKHKELLLESSWIQQELLLEIYDS